MIRTTTHHFGKDLNTGKEGEIALFLSAYADALQHCVSWLWETALDAYFLDGRGYGFTHSFIESALDMPVEDIPAALLDPSRSNGAIKAVLQWRLQQ